MSLRVEFQEKIDQWSRGCTAQSCGFIKSFSWRFQDLLSLVDDLLEFQLAAFLYRKVITGGWL
jgi:hypothetical protein